MNLCSSHFVLVLIWWWPSTLATEPIGNICDAMRSIELKNGLDNQTDDVKQLLKSIKSSKRACDMSILTVKGLKETVAEGMVAFEVITGCVCAGHVLECLVAFDALANDLPDRLQTREDESDVGFVERSNELWETWRFETKPLALTMLLTVIKWTSFLRNLKMAYGMVLPESADLQNLLNAVESLNLYLNGESLEPTERYTSAHEAYTRVELVHAHLYRTVYGYFNGHGCSRQNWTGSPWRPVNVEASASTRTLVEQRVNKAVDALNVFYAKTGLREISKISNGLLDVSQADVAEPILRPNFFVWPGNTVVWRWNGVKTNVYHVYADIQTGFQDAKLYNSLAEKTIVATFFTYLHLYLQLYVKYYMEEGTERFGENAQKDPVVLMSVRELISKMASFTKNNSFHPIIRLHNRINAPPGHSNTLSVYDLQLIIRSYLRVIEHTLEVHTNPIPDDRDNVKRAMVEYKEAMLFGLK